MSEAEPSDQGRISVSPTVVQSRIFFFLTFVALLLITALLLRPFFSVILLSFIAVIVLKPLYGRFYRTSFTQGKPRLSASVTLLSFFILLVVPVALFMIVFFNQLAAQLVGLAEFDLDSLLQELESSLSAGSGQQIALDKEAILAAIDEASSAIFGAVVDVAGRLLSSLPKLIVDIIIFLVVVVSLLPGFDRLIEELQEISPLGSEITHLYYTKASAMVTSLFKGLFLIASLQGLVMGVFYWLAGIDGVFFFAVLSMFLAMLPVVGISFLVIFMAIVFLLQGNPTSAAIVLIGFYGVANWIDIVLRPRLVSKEAYMHFALVLLGIIGGLTFAGLLGMFYGPVVILLLVTTIDIYRERYAPQDTAVVGELIRSDGGKLVVDEARAQPEVPDQAEKDSKQSFEEPQP